MKKICATCGKEIEQDEEIYLEYLDEYFHEKCLEKEYEYAEDKGYL